MAHSRAAFRIRPRRSRSLVSSFTALTRSRLELATKPVTPDFTRNLGPSPSWCSARLAARPSLTATCRPKRPRSPGPARFNNVGSKPLNFSYNALGVAKEKQIAVQVCIEPKGGRASLELYHHNDSIREGARHRTLVNAQERNLFQSG